MVQASYELALRFASVAGGNYRIEHTGQILPPNWSNIITFVTFICFMNTDKIFLRIISLLVLLVFWMILFWMFRRKLFLKV